MPHAFRLLLTTATLIAIGACAPMQATPLDAAAASRLNQLQQTPEAAGSRTYQGTVFVPGDTDATAVFRYERRVSTHAHGLAATHITYDPQGHVIIAQAAQVSPGYTLRRFDEANRQTGISGTAIASDDGRRITYTVRQGGAQHTATEVVADPVVAGPSLHGFVLHHWRALGQGQTLAVRMIVLDKLRTYGFTIRMVRQDAQHTSFSVTPGTWLVRLAVAPMTVTFDTATRHVVRYEGRVPPMREVDGELQAFDATVQYTDHAPRYR